MAGVGAQQNSPYSPVAVRITARRCKTVKYEAENVIHGPLVSAAEEEQWTDGAAVTPAQPHSPHPASPCRAFSTQLMSLLNNKRLLHISTQELKRNQVTKEK